MYMNTAYLQNTLVAPRTPLDQADADHKLKILCCGVYRITNHPKLSTNRPDGRLDYQILYFHSGQGHFFFADDKKETIVQAGQMVLFRPGEQQIYYYLADDKTEVYWVHFTGTHVEEMLSIFNFTESSKIVYSGAHIEYKDNFLKMITELQITKARYEEKLILLLQDILLMVDRNKTEKSAESKIEREIQEAAKYFIDNYNKDISIAEYAKSHFFSPYYFSSNFKLYTGYSPTQFILNLRINNAQSMLGIFKYSINEVAQLVGYNDPLYFSRIFKKTVGYSPKEYRAMLKSDNKE